MNITTEDVYKKISVRAPYFALSNIVKNGEIFSAEIPIQQPIYNEIGTISSGEIARHLAILGAISLAFTFNETNDFFYDLAVKADYDRFGEIPSNSLKANSTCQLINKKEGKAEILLLTETEKIVASLKVEYVLMPRKIFERLFKDHYIDLRRADRRKYKEIKEERRIQEDDSFKDFRDDLRKNTETDVAYRQNIYKKIINFSSLQVDSAQAIAIINQLDPELCMGHFALYPALPVAFASGIQARLCSLVIEKKLNKPITYFVKKTLVTANKLAFAGTSLKMVANFKNNEGNDYFFHTTIYDANSEDIFMHLEFILHLL